MSRDVSRRSILQMAAAPALLAGQDLHVRDLVPTVSRVYPGTVVFDIPLQDTTKENGHVESLDRHVTPRSLYLAQLRERLGGPALRHVAAPHQLGWRC